MQEGKRADTAARVGFVSEIRILGNSVSFRYQYDLDVPAIPQDELQPFAGELDLTSFGRQFDWTTTTWRIVDSDLYRLAFRLTGRSRRNQPVVFNVSTPPQIDPRQVSAMMPFDAGFTAVYQAIEAAAGPLNLQVNRADNIWEHHAIIQDVASLIDRSRIVVCDLTSRNPNVFYEAGIAHALGREVILITQNAEDVPFDLRHLRYIRYLPNAEGLADLTNQLRARITTLLVDQS